MYKKLTLEGVELDDIILKVEGNAYIPSGNSHYQEYLEWLAEGNEPLPADE